MKRGHEQFWNNPPPLFIGKKERCLPPRGFLRKISKRTSITKFTPIFVLYGKVTEALRKCFGFNFHLFFSSFSPILSEICLFRVTGILRKHYESLKSHFSTKWGRRLPSSFPRRARLLPPAKMFWKDLDLKMLFTPYLDKFTDVPSFSSIF